MSDFFKKIKKFNDMYKMESNDSFKNLGGKRLSEFHSILSEELDEIWDINPEESSEIDTAVQVADLLGDLIVYCASEARRWGIDIKEVLDIIMESNFSKLGPDGQPIYDERGKLLKGPNFFAPEDKIKDFFKKNEKI